MRNIKVVFFAKIPDLRDLNKAALYVRENEITSCLKVKKQGEIDILIYLYNLLLPIPSIQEGDITEHQKYLLHLFRLSISFLIYPIPLPIGPIM